MVIKHMSMILLFRYSIKCNSYKNEDQYNLIQNRERCSVYGLGLSTNVSVPEGS